MSPPLVSVVIPAFNAERFLAAAVGSIARQGVALETIVVDDGSSDGTLAVARALCGVQVVARTHQGIGATRNFGVTQARGRLLAFLDADDLWTDDKLTEQIAVLGAQPTLDLVGGLVEQFCDSSLPAAVPVSLPPPSPALVAGSMLIHRDAFQRVGGFRTDIAVGEFIDWHSRAVACGLRMLTLPRVVLHRRIHGNNTVLRLRGQQSNYLSVLKNHLDRKRRAA